MRSEALPNLLPHPFLSRNCLRPLTLPEFERNMGWLGRYYDELVVMMMIVIFMMMVVTNDDQDYDTSGVALWI